MSRRRLCEFRLAGSERTVGGSLMYQPPHLTAPTCALIGRLVANNANTGWVGAVWIRARSAPLVHAHAAMRAHRRRQREPEPQVLCTVHGPLARLLAETESAGLAWPQRSGAIIEGGDKCGPLVTACQGRHCTGAA